MKTIQLSQGLVAKVDDEDHERLSQYKWCVAKRAIVWYACRNVRLEDRRKAQILMHRDILTPPRGFVIDHIDHDGLNNQRSNLRVVTQGENLMNARKRRGTSSRFKGVYWDKREQRWVASITVDGKCHWIGQYTDEERAARAYDVFARGLVGHVAWANFPQK